MSDLICVESLVCLLTAMYLIGCYRSISSPMSTMGPCSLSLSIVVISLTEDPSLS